MTPGVFGVRRRGAARLLSAVTAAALVALAMSGCSADAAVPIDVPQQVDGALPDDVQTQLEAAVTDAMTVTGSAGAVVGVWAPWSGSWVAGLGTQGPAGAEVTDDLLVPIGVVTRPMTCDVLYALVAAGKVAADDPISSWVSGIPDETSVTLGQLCQGTSGIASYEPDVIGAWLANPTRVWNPRELVSYGLGAPRTGDPGAAWGDSDTGYTLLGLALERAGGANLASLYSQYVFDPLDLTSAAMPVSKAPTDGALAGFLSYANGDGTYACAEPTDLSSLSPSTGFGDSAVRADIRDLGRYVQALASRSLPDAPESRFDGALVMSADAPAWLTTSGGAIQAGSLIGQGGSIPGYTTAAYADPRSGLAVAVVLDNSAATSAVGSYLAWELAAIASKAAPASGQTAPDAGLPWTAQQYHDAIAASAVCPPAG